MDDFKFKNEDMSKDVLLVQMAQNMPMHHKIAFMINNELYIGDKENYSQGLYDNSDNSLLHISKNPNIFHFLVGRNYPDSAQDLIKWGDLNVNDFNEYKNLKEGILAKFEHLRTGDITFEGKSFDDVYNSMTLEQGDKSMNEEQSPMDVFTKDIPASDAQKGFMVSLGIKFSEEISKEEARQKITERIKQQAEYEKKMNAPASVEQLNTLDKYGKSYEDNITVKQASELISMLPATSEQLKYLNKLKLEHDDDITRGAATALINKKMRELDAKEKMPASEKQIEMMKNHGLQITEGITFGEASKAIYLLPATEKQIDFLNKHKIEYDQNKICYGLANKLISQRLEFIDEVRKQPASKEQLDFMSKNKIEFHEGITKGEASDLINKNQLEKFKATDKQIDTAKKYGLELPVNASKKMAAEMIGVALKTNAIESFVPPTDRKLLVHESYLALAQKQLKAGKTIDDKKIAGELIKQGHSIDSVKKTIYKNSPANSYSNAEKAIKEALKMPSVVKSVKESGRNM